MSMDRKTIEETITLASELVVAGQAAIERLNAENAERINPGKRPSDHSYGSKETGALRRKSMDVTRKLAELRKHS